ncbi:MerR family transcriptional regulator [Sorangium sp. So ce1128]
MDPRVRFRQRVRLARKKGSVAAWIAAENAKGHTCACGCGKPIRILPSHHSRGIPRYLRAHHPMAVTMETRQLKEAGLLTSTAVARMLGIGKTTLRRLEGTLFEPAPRQGSRKMRVFTPEQVDVLRKTLREKTRLGPKPELVGLEEIARRAACSMQTIRRRLGRELPPGRKLSQGRRAKWGFTPKEAKQIVAWVKRNVRRRRRGA